MVYVYWRRIFPENRIETYNDIFITFVCFVSACQLFQVYRRFDRRDYARFSWLLFGIGMLAETVGYGIYAVEEILFNHFISFPNIADVAIIAGVFFYVGSFGFFLSLLNHHSIRPPLSRRIAANTVFVILLIFHLFFFTFPMILDASTPIWMRILYQVYPAVDLLLAYFCLHVAMAWLTAGETKAATPWMVMVLAFFILLFTDYVYNYMTLWNLYHPYQWINPGWGLAYLLGSHAAYLQKKLMSQYQENQIELPFSINEGCKMGMGSRRGRSDS
jgi:hypothetical protein